MFPDINNEEKTRFVQEISIYDGLIISQESIHYVQQNRNPSMLIKLDINKAYDKVD